MDNNRNVSGGINVGFGFIFWLGGAVHVMRLPDYDFWDGLIWMYYVGRFVAIHFAALG